MLSRQQLIDELASRLGMEKRTVEDFLRSMVEVLGPVAAEIPPYFERYFEAQIDLVRQDIAQLRSELERRFGEVERRFGEVERRFGEVERRFTDMERRFERLERWLFIFFVPLLAAVLAAVFKLYFGGGGGP